MRVLFSVMMMAAAFAVCMFAAVRMAMPMFVAFFAVAVAVLLSIVAVAMPVHILAMLLLPVDAHLHMRPPNAAFLRRSCRNFHARNAQRAHIPQKLLPSLRLQQLVKRGHEHIPRRAHIAL